MIKMNHLLCTIFLAAASMVQAQDKKETGETVAVMDDGTRAATTADSVAKAELKKYQKEHPSRLNKGQLTLVAYTRTLNTDIKGGNGYYLFDYDYNRPLGGLMYLLHFSVMVNTQSGRTVFKAIDKP